MFDTLIDCRDGTARVYPPLPVAHTAPAREYRAPAYGVVHVWTPEGYRAPPPVLTFSAAFVADCRADWRRS